MICGVIRDVLHHFTERELTLLTLKVFKRNACAYALVAEAFDEGLLILLERGMRRFKTPDIGKLLWIPQGVTAGDDLFGRFTDPQSQPHPMSADDVNECSTHRRVTGTKVSREIFTRKKPRGGKKTPVCPVVIGEEASDVLNVHDAFSSVCLTNPALQRRRPARGMVTHLHEELDDTSLDVHVSVWN